MSKKMFGVVNLKWGLTIYCVVFVALSIFSLCWSIAMLVNKPGDRFGKLGIVYCGVHIMCTIYLFFGVVKENYEYILPILIGNAVIFLMSASISIVLGFVNYLYFAGIPIIVMLSYFWYCTYIYYKILILKATNVVDVGNEKEEKKLLNNQTM